VMPGGPVHGYHYFTEIDCLGLVAFNPDNHHGHDKVIPLPSSEYNFSCSNHTLKDPT
jgi:hypothetical protein